MLEDMAGKRYGECVFAKQSEELDNPVTVMGRLGADPDLAEVLCRNEANCRRTARFILFIGWVDSRTHEDKSRAPAIQLALVMCVRFRIVTKTACSSVGF